jgi:hypothetical protein
MKTNAFWSVKSINRLLARLGIVPYLPTNRMNMVLPILHPGTLQILRKSKGRPSTVITAAPGSRCPVGQLISQNMFDCYVVASCIVTHKLTFFR